MRTADGYIRVSKVMGRGGESFISPDEQRSAIEAWAQSSKTTILEWHTDLDQSGGTLDRPAIKAALERRGLPLISKGVSGAMRGTDPLGALIAKENGRRQ